MTNSIDQGNRKMPSSLFFLPDQGGGTGIDIIHYKGMGFLRRSEGGITCP
jgi:hypothetical protein